LAFDSLEPLESGLLDVLAHSTYYIPIRGNPFKAS
jgi:hypothetical protein